MCSFLAFRFSQLCYDLCCYYIDRLLRYDNIPVVYKSQSQLMPSIEEEKEDNASELKFVWRSTSNTQPFYGSKGISFAK